MPLTDMTLADKLRKRLDKAHSTSSAHLAKGGRFAQVKVACLHFDKCSECEQSAIESEKLGRAASIALEVPGLGAAPDLVRLHFSVQEDKFLVAAENSSESMTLDFTVVSSALILDYRNVWVQMGGSFEKTTAGLMALTRGAAVATKALTEGVLCVINVRDGMPEYSNGIVATLHLDSTGRHTYQTG